ncbi:choline dehydrogenase [Croceicoccus ponticola]|uniref:Choline dehydrogenase n=1 Tax=Croceicoccus ponticola TaxID=2217664 RepID=A0A437H221_9SPHN|nr:GMC family oxidoreductase N-terminal domain-containing protein [Croceicoccus ponticola]RVQ69675.1 choline dehydrogenase [Croceicoccus ponticola]
MSSDALASADIVIVGGGTAGCVLADRLTESGECTVILIEAGSRDTNPWIHIPIGYGKLLGHPDLDWGYSTVPQPMLDQRQVAVPRGKVLGGSSSTNGLLYVRGQAEDYDDWAKAGADGWSFADTLPYFRKSEDQARGSDSFHGVGGPISVRDPAIASPLGDAFIAGGNEIGIPFQSDFNGPSQTGIGYYQMAVRGRVRCSTAAAYLKRAKNRRNLRVLTDATVEKILFEGGRAVGVEARRSGVSGRILARNSVVLSGGALATPQLLMLSGIGPATHLQNIGIDVLLDSPGVGVGLQDHLNVRVRYRCAQPVTINDSLRSAFGKLKSGLRYIAKGEGPLMVAAGYGAAFFRSDGSHGRPDFQGYLLLFSTDDSGRALERHSGFMTSGYQLRPKSSGALRLTGPNQDDPLSIDPAYLNDDEDSRVLIGGLRRLQQIVASDAMRPWVAGDFVPGIPADDQEWMEYIRANASAGHHFCGTCRIGSDVSAVVSPRLQVRGLNGLRIVDASVMPKIISGNTMAPVVMIAEKASDMILEDLR